MSRKQQVVALITPEVKTRIEALRIAMRVSRARVMEAGWQPGGLAALEAEHAAELRKLNKLARAAGVDVATYVAAYARAYSHLTYGPTVAGLLADDSEVRKTVGLLDES